MKRIQSFWFSYDPIAPCAIIEQDQGGCLLLGMANDLLDPVMDSQKLALSLLVRFLRSEEDFYKLLDRLTGRFLVVVSNGYTTQVYQDACGMRNVFYSTQDRILSSHLELLVDQMQERPTPQRHLLNYLQKYTSYYLPGNITPYENVYWLTPNTTLDLEDMSVSRFFPREPLVEGKPEVIYDEVVDLLTRQAEFIVRRYRTLISLSAGTDSRSTLALLRDVRDGTRFFTYFKSCDLGKDEMNARVLLQDKITARDIARNLRLNHTLVDVDYAQQDSPDYCNFASVMARNTYQHHNFYLAWKCLQSLPSNHLHIFSMHQGIPKRIYLQKVDLLDEITSSSMAYCYHRDAADDSEVENHFSEFAAVTQLDQNLNWNPYDLFYWEYRMGVWAPTVPLESDAAFDTFCLFNNRFLLNKIFELPESHLQEYRIYSEIYKRKWPILAYWTINDGPSPIHQFPVGGLSLDDCSLVGRSAEGDRLNVYRRSSEDGILFYLNLNPPKKGDHVTFTKPLTTIPGQGYFLAFKIVSPYVRPGYTGRMRINFLLGNRLIGWEDVADWGQTNLIQILFEAQAETTPMTVEVAAQKDCEKWSWGSAARVFVHEINFHPISYQGDMRANCSSPFSELAVRGFTRDDIDR